MLLEGQGGPVDALHGESWLRRAALGGDAAAAAALGARYARADELSPNYAEAGHWYRIAAERGHQGAAHALGMFYFTGAGCARDPDEAAAWFKRAAEAVVCAQASLAVLLQSGAAATLMQAPPPVHEWFERAAEQGDMIGAFNYAVCLAEGVGVPRDEERAAFWLQRAAATVVNAQYWYARMLAEGRGVARDVEAAAAWFTRAAEAGLVEAQVALARFWPTATAWRATMSRRNPGFCAPCRRGMWAQCSRSARCMPVGTISPPITKRRGTGSRKPPRAATRSLP